MSNRDTHRSKNSPQILFEYLVYPRLQQLLGADEIITVRHQVRRRSTVFPFVVATPDFVVLGKWEGKTELVVVEVKSVCQSNTAALQKARGVGDYSFQVQAQMYAHATTRGALILCAYTDDLAMRGSKQKWCRFETIWIPHDKELFDLPHMQERCALVALRTSNLDQGLETSLGQDVWRMLGQLVGSYHKTSPAEPISLRKLERLPLLKKKDPQAIKKAFFAWLEHKNKPRPNPPTNYSDRIFMKDLPIVENLWSLG